jgi:methionine synthase I (cobalamin-dependent)
MPDSRRVMHFRAFLDSRPMLLDAAMGTRLSARGLDLSRQDPSLWNLEAPDGVRAIHESDRAAGSDAVFTNSFGIHLATVPDAVADRVNAASVGLARAAIGASGFVIASLGPREIWRKQDLRQVDILMENGVDALALETIRPGEASAALGAIRGRTDLPILVSVFARPERDFWRKVADAGADIVGVNCLSDFGEIRAILEDAARAVTLPLLVKPSAGLPGDEPVMPEALASEAITWLERGARLLGGCCGTTERHIGALRTMLDAKELEFRPDKVPEIGL